jgi:uncharacterized protein YjbJ (UPF0337 family)
MLSKGEIKGKVRQVIGAIKENLGWLTDDHKAEGEGKVERRAGELQELDAKVHREAGKAEEELAKRAAGSN